MYRVIEVHLAVTKKQKIPSIEWKIVRKLLYDAKIDCV